MVARTHDDFATVEEILSGSLNGSANEQRFLARLGREHGYEARRRLDGANEWLSIRDVSRVLGCSKSTVRKLVQRALLRSRKIGLDRRHKRIRIPWDSVRNLIRATQVWERDQRLQPRARRSSFVNRFLQTASRPKMRAIPAKLTIADAAALIGCSRASVLRMIHRGELRAERRTPYRWLVLKTSFLRVRVR